MQKANLDHQPATGAYARAADIGFTLRAAQRRPQTAPALAARLAQLNGASDLHVAGAADPEGLFAACWLDGAAHRYRIRDAEHVTVVFFLEGDSVTFEVDAGDETRAGRAGQTAIVPAGASATWSCPGSMRYLVVCLSTQLVANGSPVAVDFRCFSDDPVLRRLGFVLADVLLRGESCDGAETLAWATVLGRHLARYYCAADSAGQTGVGACAVGVHRAIRFIDDNLPEKLTVAELAERAGMSRVKFARSFKEATGTSPYRYIITRRLSKARQLLASSRLSLGEIAYAVGFSSQSHLTSTFHRSVGVTPREYREALEKYLP